MDDEILSDEIIDDTIDESILKLVFEKNLKRNDLILDLELKNQSLNNNIINKSKKIKTKKYISLQSFLKTDKPIYENIRKFNPRLPPYNLCHNIIEKNY